MSRTWRFWENSVPGQRAHAKALWSQQQGSSSPGTAEGWWDRGQVGELQRDVGGQQPAQVRPQVPS